jgi:hypothetical protein
MSHLYGIALAVVVWCWYAAAGTRGHLRVVLSVGAAVTIAALLLSASSIVATDNPLLLVLFLLGTCAFGYTIIVAALSTPRPKP